LQVFFVLVILSQFYRWSNVVCDESSKINLFHIKRNAGWVEKEREINRSCLRMHWHVLKLKNCKISQKYRKSECIMCSMKN
jgi:hypothetical protein